MKCDQRICINSSPSTHCKGAIKSRAWEWTSSSCDRELFSSYAQWYIQRTSCPPSQDGHFPSSCHKSFSVPWP
jgi:hypothetical protein